MDTAPPLETDPLETDPLETDPLETELPLTELADAFDARGGPAEVRLS